jgi:hypothetical protein
MLHTAQGAGKVDEREKIAGNGELSAKSAITVTHETIMLGKRQKRCGSEDERE